MLHENCELLDNTTPHCLVRPWLGAATSIAPANNSFVAMAAIKLIEHVLKGFGSGFEDESLDLLLREPKNILVVLLTKKIDMLEHL